MNFECGDFSVDVWQGGAPVWIHVRHNGNELRFSHSQLPFLEFAIKQAKKAAKDALPEKYKHEVD